MSHSTEKEGNVPSEESNGATLLPVENPEGRKMYFPSAVALG
jgi:hypothetical protein